MNSLPRNHGKEERKKEPKEDNKDKKEDKTDPQERTDLPEEKVTMKPEVGKEEEVDPEEID